MRKILSRAVACLSAAVLLGALPLGAQTLMHSYTFEEATLDLANNKVNDAVGTLPATISGTGLVFANGSVTNTNAIYAKGGYLSFVGTDLALNTYSSITLETYLSTCNDQNNPNRWTMLTYFGNASGAKSFFMSVERRDNVAKVAFNQGAEVGATGTEPGKSQIHHYVSVLIPATADADGSISLYIDGVLTTTTVLPFATATNQTAISGIGTDLAYLFKGGYTDPLWTGTVHEFNIYNGAMDAAAVAARFAQRDSKLASMSASANGNALSLWPAFDANVKGYSLKLAQGTTSVDVAAVAAQTSAAVTGTGTIDVSGEKGTIMVNANGTTDATYAIHWYKELTTCELKHAYTFDDGTANDMVGTANGTVKGGSVAKGLFTTSAAANFNSGTSQYIELNAANIAINQYDELTLETYVKPVSGANPFLFYLGGQVPDFGISHVYLHSGEAVVGCQTYGSPWYGVEKVAFTSTLNALPHHLVMTVSNEKIKLYRDGVFVSETALSGYNKLFNLSNQVAYIGRGGYVNDVNVVASFGEVNIYNGQMDASTVDTRYNAFKSAIANANLASLSVDNGSLSPAFDAATTAYSLIVPAGTTFVNVAALAANEFASVTGTGAVDVSSGAAVATVNVTSGDGTVTNSYTVNISVDTPTRIDASNANGVTVFPTLTSGNVTVSFAGSLGRITVSDLTGKKLLSFMATSKNELIALPHNGIFFVSVESEGSSKTVKVVRQ